MDSLIGIGDLAAILAVVSVGIYVLGLMGLAVTIRLRLVDNISVAWYAVSLLPRTVVAGHGVRIWLTWPIGLTFVLGITTFLRGIADARGVPVDEDLFLLVVFIVGLLITLISFLRIRKAGGPRFAAHYDPFLVVGVTLISAWIGIFMMSIAVQVIGEVVIDAQPAPPANSQTVPGIIFPPVNDQIVAGTMLLFVGSFIVGVPAGLSVEPPLRTVEVTKMNGHSAIRGRLVSHSEGFWHLFVEPNSEVSYELLAIPDSEVLTVRIVGAADANRAEVAKVNAERDTERDK